MKKLLLLSSAILLAGVVVGSAGDRRVGAPRNQDGTVRDSWDYSGVSYSTPINLSGDAFLVFSGEGEVVGFVASSNTAFTDFVSFRDSGTAVNDNNLFEFARVFLSTTNSVNTSLGTRYLFPAPVRVKKGLVAEVTATLPVGVVTPLYHKFGADHNTP